MTPTAELRWVERTIKRDLMDDDRVVIKDSIVTGNVLQQKWVEHHIPAGQRQATFEWRDVPVAKEETK